MKICILLGTRPEIIKMEPIIEYYEGQKILNDMKKGLTLDLIEDKIDLINNAGIAVTYPKIRNMNTVIESGLKVAEIVRNDFKIY